MDIPDTELNITSPAIGFFQLAATLLERANVHTLGPSPTTTILRAVAAKLNTNELRGFALGLLC